jgi:hypothetical protein
MGVSADPPARRRKGYLHTGNHKESSTGNVNPPTDGRSTTDSDGGEQGDALASSEQKRSAIGADCETECDSDTELHLDGEEEAKPDTLYRDGIDIEEDGDTLAGTHGSSGTIP